MSIFFSNRLYRVLLLNQWISSFGDTLFYLSLISYISQFQFAPLAIMLITLSETIPELLQIIFGVLADFQGNRVLKYAKISWIKFLLYAGLTLYLALTPFSIISLIVICLVNIISDTLSYFAGAMLTPIYIRIIKKDMTRAMGFRQASFNLVRIFSNLAGASLIGFLSLSYFVGVNALTFLCVFLSFTFLKKDLLTVEETLESQTSQQKTTSLAALTKHTLASLSLLKNQKELIHLLLLSGLGQVILSVMNPLASLTLLKTSWYGLEVGHLLSFLMTATLVGLIIGNALSALLMKKLSTRQAIYLGQFARLGLLLGYLLGDFSIIFIASFSIAIVVGIIGPRLHQMVFERIPESMIGTIQSGISTFSMVVPNVLALAVVALATSLGVGIAVLILASMVFLSFALLRKIR